VGQLWFRHRNVLKSMKKVKALSRLAGGNPHGCNVGKFRLTEQFGRPIFIVFIR